MPENEMTHPSRILPFNAQLKAKPLKTRDDVQRALVDILTPAMNLCLGSRRLARFHMSDSCALYNTDRNQIEGFSRLLRGLGPLFIDPANIKRYPNWWRYITDSLTHAVDPTDPDYWGSNLTDYDQLFVEMGAVVAFLHETREAYWANLTPAQQRNMFACTSSTPPAPSTLPKVPSALPTTGRASTTLPSPPAQPIAQTRRLLTSLKIRNSSRSRLTLRFTLSPTTHGWKSSNHLTHCW